MYAYDFGDTAGFTPLLKMHTLGHEFIPDPIHAGGLRYHGMSPLLSHIYELGLIYDIIVDASSAVGIRMTLTAPACPAAQTLPVEVRNKIAQIPDVTDVKVDIVWDPPWDRDRMSDAAKLQLGMF